ncbi:MAG: N-acetylmuramoyl-L-alanine amidase [Planctomycetota bacterium]|nr:MAG: N-acetylmuramoyl-L-alanine amidase [Planctomycetota bacterium]
MPRHSRKRDKALTRTRLVWGSLVLSMSIVGGALAMLVDDAGTGRGGLTLSPLVSISRDAFESIFETDVPIEPGRWDSIVITHSATPYGTPASLDARQRQASQQGLGHHFVIGNGSGMSAGEIHVGYRWLEQLPAALVFAHGQGADANRALSICLVGDGNRQRFDALQVQRLAQLVAELARRCEIPESRVYLHSDVAGTSSPGRYFPEAQFRELLAGLR